MTIVEKILSYMAGESESLPPVNTELERLLAKIAEGGGGGGGGGALVVNATYEDGGTVTTDKTWKEIHDAIAGGTPAYIKGVSTNDGEETAYWPIMAAKKNDYNFWLVFPFDSESNAGPLGAVYFNTSNENGYPSYIPE